MSMIHELAETPLSRLSADHRFAFVRVVTGVWVRTHPCVLYIACPHCKAQEGELCKGKRYPVSETHHSRRRAFTQAKRHYLPPSTAPGE